MKEIKLSQFGKNRGKFVALVDDEDFERVNQYRWCVAIRKNTNYAIRKYIENGVDKFQLLHRFILNVIDKIQVDHKDHNGLNDQKYNIRACSYSQNFGNNVKRNGCTSKYKGVHLFKATNTWQTYININKVRTNLGYFKNEIDAAKAYDAKAKELFGEFALFNFHD